jgi:pimeloyl-ACP methyl ester carboxylesterase
LDQSTRTDGRYPLVSAALASFPIHGMIAQAYALKYPNWVSHLILADTFVSA